MVPSVLLQGESTAWTKLRENKSEKTRGRKWARNFPTQELLDVEGGFGSSSETLMKENDSKGPEFGSVLITTTTANTQSRQKPVRQAASLPLCACDLSTALQVKVPTGSGAETGDQSGSICWAERVGDTPQAAGVVKHEENVQEQTWWAQEPFSGFWTRDHGLFEGLTETLLKHQCSHAAEPAQGLRHEH